MSVALEENGMNVWDAVVGRRSVRRFLDKPVPEKIVRDILEGASRAASGTNMQPWMVHVVSGAAKERLSATVSDLAEKEEASLEYNYLPENIKEPYRSRRRKVGFDLYEKYGVERDDMQGRKAAMLRNYRFFGAPIGLFFTLDRSMSMGSWLDCGMFMQNVMLLARGFGLETCPQQAWCDFGAGVRQELHIPEEHIILSGMALGYIDESAPENRLVTERADVGEFSTWHID